MNNMTAKVSCFARAYHYKNNIIHIFEDNAAECILAEDYEQISIHMTAGLQFFFPGFKGTKEEGLRLIVEKQLAPSVLGRSVYCERKLADEKTHGCKQYLIFASGYDTFALRNTDDSLAVYELELPEILSDKQERIEKANLKNRAIYVPCDLADSSWKDKLMKVGYCREQKAFGSLLGISYYLTKEDFENLLMNISEIMTEGCVICFDYPAEHESKETATNQMLAAGAGEQMKALYSRQEIMSILQKGGFEIIEHLNHDEMTKMYFEEYNNSSPKHMMQAPVGVNYVAAVKKM